MLEGRFVLARWMRNVCVVLAWIALVVPAARLHAEDAPVPAATLPQIEGVDARAVLSSFGSFVQNPKYGEVWVPTVTPPGWHPYPPCHWVQSRTYGWYFDDRTPWGSIVHHYGRWAFDAQAGWLWVPDDKFSPGWVVWRTNAQWIGWAPMPPQGDLDTMTAAAFDTADYWIFMGTAKFAQGCDPGGTASAQSIPQLLATTTFVTEVAYLQGIVVFVLPQYVFGDVVDVHIAFEPWPTWFIVLIMADWNWVWSNLTVAIDVAAPCPPK
jgi:hypothetical protein